MVKIEDLFALMKPRMPGGGGILAFSNLGIIVVNSRHIAVFLLGYKIEDLGTGYN